MLAGEINDNFGHDRGDIVAGVGGDEFLLYFDRAVLEGEVGSVATRFASRLDESQPIEDHETAIEAPVGNSVDRSNVVDVATRLRDAEEGTHGVKRSRPGRLDEVLLTSGSA